MAEQYKQYGYEKAGEAQQTIQGMMGTAEEKEKSSQMKDMTQQKASQVTEATKGMGQSVMGSSQQGKEQIGSFFQQSEDKAMGATQSVMEVVKSPFGGSE